MPRRLLLLAVLAVLAAPPLAPERVAGAAAHPAAATASVLTPAFGRGFRSRGFGSNRRFAPSRPARGARPARPRPRPNIGRFFGNVLRALGIAYLVHLLFGWGAGGGSPLVLLILVVFAVWLFSRSRRRRERWYGSH